MIQVIKYIMIVFPSADQIKRIELREFNQKEGNYDNKRTIQLNIGEKSDIYDVSSDIEFVEVMIVSQYSVEQEKISHKYLLFE